MNGRSVLQGASQRHLLVLFGAANLFAFASVFTPVRAGAWVALFCLFTLPLVAVKIGAKGSIIFWSVLFYFAVEITSLLNYAVNSFTVGASDATALLASVSYLLIPQAAFFFAGVYSARQETRLTQTLYGLLRITTGMLIVSLVMHLMKPWFYDAYMQRVLGDLYWFYGGRYPRLFGYLDSMALGVICSSMLPIALFLREHGKERMLHIVVIIASALLTLQRGAILTVALGLVTYTLLRPKRTHRHPNVTMTNRFVRGMLVVFVTSMIVGLLTRTDFRETSRLMIGELIARKDLVEAVRERSQPWFDALEIANENPLGVGLGVLSHKASSTSRLMVADGNYFRILGELGWVGLLVFIAILGMAIMRSYAMQRKDIIMAISAFALQAVGTNVFDLYYASFLFWALIGVIVGARSGGAWVSVQ